MAAPPRGELYFFFSILQRFTNFQIIREPFKLFSKFQNWHHLQAKMQN